jgi:GNAT superfamily N-acetyltransferase
MNPPLREFKRDEYLISTDPSRFDLPWIHGYLINDAYWSRGISFQVFRKSVENALCFGVFHQEVQVGFGRVISDYATFAYLADIFIDEHYRRRGLGKWLVECMLNFPELQGLRRWILVTKDAHGLYEQFGFVSLKRPESMMEIVNKDIDPGI